MDLVKYAKKEFELQNGKEPESGGYAQMVESALLELVEVFSNQGHSGMSAAMVSSRLSRVIQYKPLTPLTGEESERGGEGAVSESQNNRYSAVFRRDDGTAYNIDGKVFTNDGGKTWFTNKDSHVDITFPYTVPNEPEEVYL